MKEKFKNQLIPSGEETRIMDIIEGKEKKPGLESIFRQIVDENFPNLRNELELVIQ